MLFLFVRLQIDNTCTIIWVDKLKRPLIKLIPYYQILIKPIKFKFKFKVIRLHKAGEGRGGGGHFFGWIVFIFGLTYASWIGNWKTTSLLVSFLYTKLNVSNLVSTLTWSLGSNSTFRILEPSSLHFVLLPTISVG